MSTRSPAQAALVVGALGVVFGDIGTSPIYTIQTVFNPGDPHPVTVTAESVFGIVSLIFWSVTIVVTLGYVLLVMRADNEGEGGIMALITLVGSRRTHGGRRTKVILAGLGIFGASLFFGDSMITPAISVLSAVEGVKVVQPSLAHLVVPITAVIIVILFATQRIGSAAVGRMFGPVMTVWFLAIGACGVHGIVQHTAILKALSPTYALSFLSGHFAMAFFSLAAVVLAITGAEALYADLGHFGRAPITRAWLLLVFPACILSYMGQGALVLADPHGAVRSPFFLLVPHWGRLPMVVLATMATVIASQAVISGAFSVAHQAVQLGYLPRLRVTHTSAETAGQIYVPWINWLLMVAVLTLVFTFQTANALAFAFGMAVTGTITITTALFFYLARERWGRPLWLVVHRRGRLPDRRPPLLRREPDQADPRRMAAAPDRRRGLHDLHHVAARARPRHQAPGARGGFAEHVHRRDPQAAPTAPPRPRHGGVPAPPHHHNATRHARQRRAESHPARARRHPLDRDAARAARGRGRPARRSTTSATRATGSPTSLPASGTWTGPTCRASCGSPSRPGSNARSRKRPTSSRRSTSRSAAGAGMSRWRKHLFLATSRITADAAEYFGLPRHRTVIMGSRIDV